MKVSIVVLTKNPIPVLFEDLQNQTYQDFELILATEKGIVNAMNIALAKAKGDIFVRIDDDVFLPQNWLAELVSCFEDPLIVGATGPTYIPEGQKKNRDSIDFVSKHIDHWFFKWLMDGNPHAPAKIFNCGCVSYASNFCEFIRDDKEYEIDHLEGTNWAVRTKWLRCVKFDPLYDGVCEWYDDDALYKILKALPRGKLKYNPKAFLLHLIKQGDHYEERFAWVSRLKNWLRFHRRHSKFHPKMILWFLLMVGYYLKKSIRK